MEQTRPDARRGAVSGSRGLAVALTILLAAAGAAAAQETPAPPPAEAPPAEAPAAAPSADAAPAPAVVQQPAPDPAAEAAPAVDPAVIIGAAPPVVAQPADAPAPDAAPPSVLAAPQAAPGVEAPAAASAVAELPHDLSPWGMFMAADVVVKAVMIGLAVASLVTWTVLLAKSAEIFAAGLRLRRGLREILNSADLGTAEQALAGRRGPAAQMIRAARSEAGASTEALSYAGGAGLLQRVSSHLSRIEAQAGRRLAVGTGLLATIGATAPFVGLFGTVWGIMNSFIGISESQTTNLAVVAPGIAEALLATALGLVAAIPAVVVYNVFARWIAGYRAQLADAAAAVERLVSRDLDHRRLEPERMRQAAE